MRTQLANFPRPFLLPYIIFGGSIVISGLILFAIPIIKRKKESQVQPTDHEWIKDDRTYSRQNLSASDENQQI